MLFSDESMCAILLCSSLGISEDNIIKPVSIGNWDKLKKEMDTRSISFNDLLLHTDEAIEKMSVSEQFTNQIRHLLSRGAVVAVEIDDYNRKGINIVTEFDKEYPKLLSQRLKNKKPPVLFYAGNIDLANKIGIAVVGSRNVCIEGCEFTRELVRKAIGERLVIFSGGAKGVDSIAENEVLMAGGVIVEYIADSLSSKIKRKDYIKPLSEGRMLIFSDMKPEIGFASWRAMNRNKYIYASSSGAFVIEADYNKGGTWEGACENQKNRWVRNFVWNNIAIKGNQKLIENGGSPYLIGEKSLLDTICEPLEELEVNEKTENYVQMDIFSFLGQNATS